jgi:hypothetical protein
MPDLKKARMAFMELIEDLDPAVECVIPPKPAQGNYLIELTRADEKQVVKVSEKELMAIEDDEDIRQKLEERVTSAIEKLPEAAAEAADEEDEEFDEEAFDEEDEDEDEEDDLEEEEEEEEEPERE